MKKFVGSLFGMLAVLAMALPASAHFMVMYTPETAQTRATGMDMRMVFTHPAEAGHTMNMGGIQDFYAVYQRGDSAAKKIDLKGYVKEIKWTNPHSSNTAYAANLPKKVVRSMGDYTFVMVPGYYFEEEEGVYMQQIAKLVANIGGVPGNWSEPVGLPCEIVPLIRPYGLWTGNVFKARVLSAGKPVAGAEVEVEFMNHMPDLKKNAMHEKGLVEYPNDTLVTQTIFTDSEGYITFGIPKAGWWGFAALGVGPEKEYKGKELSQDAVLWVQAVDMK
jgi:cobalt/nickel transport protein